MVESKMRIGEVAPSPPPLRPEEEIVERWSDGPPVVSVLCPTYNHVDFIEDAICGILGQETTFPFEVIIRDDASSDGTADIVREFELKYPQIIRAIYETENQYRVERVRERLSPLVRGQFVAYCEGDDYWIRPEKLQRQLSALSAQADKVVSHHQAVVVENGRIVSLGKLPASNERDFTANELQRGAWLLTLSLFHRRVEIVAHPKSHRFVNVDKYVTSRLGGYGGASYEKDFTGAVYRRHDSSVWGSLDQVDRNITQATSYYYIATQYFGEGNSRLGAHWLRKARRELSRAE